MSTAFGLARTVTKTRNISRGLYLVNTEEALDSNLWSAGDLLIGCGCPSIYYAHTCMTSRRQFQLVFDRFDADLEDSEIVDYLTTAIRLYGQLEPAAVVNAEGRLTVHNGHHRFYVCHLLKIPYYIDVDYD